jgi:hypothetical protein
MGNPPVGLPRLLLPDAFPVAVKTMLKYVVLNIKLNKFYFDIKNL